MNSWHGSGQCLLTIVSRLSSILFDWLALLCWFGLVLRLGSVYFDLLAVIIWLRYVSPSGE